MADEIKKTVNFHYLKTPVYRTFHVDGALGGQTPSGGVWLTFYIERGAIPQLTTNEIGSDGHVGRELARESKKGIIREMECGIMMSQTTATNLHDWLGRVLRDMKAGANEG
jgi:hypothetical protein